MKLPRALWWSVVASLFILEGCHRSSEQPNGSKLSRKLHRGLGGDPGSLDPAKAADTFSFEVLADLYEGLTTQTPSGEAAPGVAERWSVSDDGKTYTFELRHDAMWSNGEPINAQQFVTAWRRMVDPKTGSPSADNLRIVAGADAILAGRQAPETLGITALTDYRLIVMLESPAPYFPQLLTHPSTAPVYSATAAASRSGQSWVSNGAYVLSSWTPGTAIVLNQNKQYWGRAHVAIGAVHYLPAPDDSTELTRYRAGELDLTETVPAGAAALIAQERPAELHTAPYLGTVYYAFDLHEAPFKENRELRQALAMAIDRRRLLGALLPFGQQPAYGLVANGTANYAPQSWDWKSLSDDERETQARALYAKAGYGPNKPLHLALLYNSSAAIKQMTVAIADMWRTVLGIDTVMSEEEYRVFLESRKNPWRYDIVRLGWTADYNDAGNFLNTLRSNSPNNDAGYKNAAYDDLLARADHSADPNARRQLLEEAERTMLKDYPIIPVYFFSSKRLVQPDVKGVFTNPLAVLYSKDLSFKDP